MPYFLTSSSLTPQSQTESKSIFKNTAKAHTKKVSALSTSCIECYTLAKLHTIFRFCNSGPAFTCVLRFVNSGLFFFYYLCKYHIMCNSIIRLEYLSGCELCSYIYNNIAQYRGERIRQKLTFDG